MTRFSPCRTLLLSVLLAACGSPEDPGAGKGGAATGTASGGAGGNAATGGNAGTGGNGAAGGGAGAGGNTATGGNAGSGGTGTGGTGTGGSTTTGSGGSGANPDAGGSGAGGNGGAGVVDASSDRGGAGDTVEGGRADAVADARSDSGVQDPGTDGDGDFINGPTFTPSPDLAVKSVPHGKIFNFTMNSVDSIIYTGLDTTLLPANQHAYTRSVSVYVPMQYVDGAEAPFMVVQDGPSHLNNLKNALDNLIADKRLPHIVGIFVNHGGGDSKGSERGLEYDTMSDRYSRFIETEVLPAVKANAAIKAAYPNLLLTSNPEGRATYGCSSGGAAALTMGWFHPELYRRIITYSGTFVDQQDDDDPNEVMYPLGAWEYHARLIENSDPKPLRIFVQCGENDNGSTDPESTHHNWVMANQRTAADLKAKNYHYRFVFSKGASHCDGAAAGETIPTTLLWAWRGYPIP
ncbi:MAG TPA: alpha/beta hydrolase-fold protein [Polyangiaceae bacterium]|nr:alpha/beta hydrolase-fold protein [Polyangiaceae bacterium]